MSAFRSWREMCGSAPPADMGELSRQFQCAIEAHRAEAADEADVAQARKALEVAWLQRRVA